MQISTKIKHFVSAHFVELSVSAIIIIVAFSSFYLGRASMDGSSDGEGITIVNDERLATTSAEVAPITKAPSEAKITSAPKPKVQSPKAAAIPAGSIPADTAKGSIVASKNGKRYYYPGCSGISRISDANKIYFASAIEAERFGLTLAANCSSTK
jgi:hypothetical protein